MEFGKAPYQSNVSLTNNILSYHFVHILFVSFLFHHQFFISCSSFSKYIHRELVVNNVFSPSCLPTFLLDWVDVNSNIRPCKLQNFYTCIWWLELVLGLLL